MALEPASPGFPEEIRRDNGENPLTCIHPAYTLAATQTEADRIMIRHFLEALAETAMAAAARRLPGSGGEGTTA